MLIDILASEGAGGGEGGPVWGEWGQQQRHMTPSARTYSRYASSETAVACEAATLSQLAQG